MLRIYHSNRLDILEEIIGFIIHQQPLNDPFTAETILVQSSGMAQWLQMSLAEKFTIAANLNFPLPARFIWQMFTRVITDIPDDDAFTRHNMHWRLMTLLPTLIHNPAFTPLRRYLHDHSNTPADDPGKLFQLCWRIADLYDQYLIHRPGWLTRWQAGEQITGLADSQHWQAPLWQALVAHTVESGLTTWHKASLYQRFIQALQQNRPPATLPERVFICGISSLPPVYLHALQALGHHCDVHLMVTNPCRHYWGNILDNAAQAHIKHPLPAHPQPDATGASLAGNPLLASWGKQGRDYISLLAELSHYEDIDAFADIPRDSLLHHLQADILELNDPTNSTATDSQHKRAIDTTDRSLTLHICHSAQREMEVLHDQLLTLLDQHPQLTPRDIIVMVPDIDHYYPYIQAVFGAAQGERHIPYAVSDRRTRQIHPLLQAVFSLLALPESRFTSEDILQLLEVPALASRFAIDETGLAYLRQWIAESGIRWGLDDDNLREFNLPATGQHTWRFGLSRMLLGYAMDSDAGQWQHILPYDATSGLIAALAGQLAELLDKLHFWRKTLATTRQAADWLPLLREILADFFIADSQTTPLLSLIEQQWQSLIRAILDARYPHPLPIALLRDELENQLEQQRSSPRFLAGAVNFCTLMPMRAIPFNIICLVGMNDGVYPRPLPPLGFDLMQQHPERGDRSRRDDDRYLLLEALLSARQTLYISYTGRSIQDNHPCQPSVLIQELFDYISQSHCLAGDESLDADTSARRLHHSLTTLHPRTPFDAKNFIVTEKADAPATQQITTGNNDTNRVHASDQLPDHHLQSYAAHWLPAASGQGQPHGPFSQPLPPLSCTQIDIDSLQHFWRHPVRGFFQMRLHISFSHHSDETDNDEPFILDPLQSYLLNQQLLDTLIDGENPHPLYQRYRGAGLLPYGAFGELLWQRHLSHMQSLADKIRPQRRASHPLEIDLDINGIRLTGWLPRLQTDGLLHWHPASLDARHGLSLWLEHLVCCASGHAVTSRIYGDKNSQWRFLPLPVAQARHHLQHYLQGYQQGLNQPLILPLKSAGAWLNACYQPASQQIDWSDNSQRLACNKLKDLWHGGYQNQPEGQDPYYQRLAIDLTQDSNTETLTRLAASYLLPLWQHHQPEEHDG